MYISSTNIYINPSEYSSNIPSNLITSEKYYNCENFFMFTNHKKRKLFDLNRAGKK